MPKYIDVEPYTDCRIVANSEDKGIAVKDIPTADVVKVVRCKDCIYYDKTEAFNCTFVSRFVEDDDYCSYAERKQNENRAY